MAKQTRRKKKVPGIFIPVSILSDGDVVALMHGGDDGKRAILIFLFLLVRAHEQCNQGVFKWPLDLTARLVHSTPDELTQAIDLIARVCEANGTEPWVYRDGNTVVLRSYSKWNTPRAKEQDWGGRRDGAGRKSSGNQVEIKMIPTDEIKTDSSGPTTESRCVPSVSVSDSVSSSREDNNTTRGREAATSDAAGKALAAVEEWAGRPLASRERQSLVDAILALEGVEVPPIHGKAVAATEMALLAIADLRRNSPSLKSVPGVAKSIGTVVTRCITERCLPGEFKRAPPGAGSGGYVDRAAERRAAKDAREFVSDDDFNVPTGNRVGPETGQGPGATHSGDAA